MGSSVQFSSVTQLCPTPSDPMNCSPPGPSIHMIFQARVLEWGAIAFSKRLAEWIQKQDPYICCLQEIHLKTRDTYRLKVKGWKKIFHANRNQKKAGVGKLISDKIDFKKRL